MLEAEDSQRGGRFCCPACGSPFVIPSGLPLESAEQAVSSPAAPADKLELAGNAFLRIPCPKGHLLDAPLDWMDEEVLCPMCKSKFRLRRKNSLEVKRHRELETEVRDSRRGRLWLQISIGVAAAIGIGLLGLAIRSM